MEVGNDEEKRRKVIKIEIFFKKVDWEIEKEFKKSLLDFIKNYV